MNSNQALATAAAAALNEMAGLAGVHESMPVQASPPYAIVAAGLETDWGHKSGTGRELRLTITLSDRGERPDRLRALAEQAQLALEALGPELDGWRLVTLVLVRSMTVAESPGRWLVTLDYRARMLAEDT